MAGPPRGLLITRPAEEQPRTALAAQAAGFQPIAAPLLQIMALAFELPADLPPVLLFTSARAPALAAARFPALRHLPAYAVGRHTAEAAHAAGFRVHQHGDLDGNAIVATAFAAGVRHMLHLCGEQRAHFAVPAGLHIARRAVYRAVAVERLPEPAVAALREGAGVLLMSPRSAAIHTALFDAAGLRRADTRLAVISAAAAAAAGTGWGAVRVAARPDLEAGLAAARLLWQGD